MIKVESNINCIDKKDYIKEYLCFCKMKDGKVETVYKFVCRTLDDLYTYAVYLDTGEITFIFITENTKFEDLSTSLFYECILKSCNADISIEVC